jgi:flagellar protein FliO/FliZ
MNAGTSGLSAWSGLWPLLAFGLVIALIPAALWVLRRSGLAGTGTPGLLRTVGGLALSPSQRVVVVELGHGAEARWMVLGVSAERINLLANVEPQSGPEGGTAPGANGGPLPTPAQSVAQLIERWRAGDKSGKSDKSGAAE